MEFILTENPTTGYWWRYDETIIGDTFTVTSSYKQDASCKKHPIGCGGKRHFQVKGQKEGNGTLFTYNLRSYDGDVRYDVMHNLLGSNCKEIKITVEKDESNSLAQTNDSDDSYDLDNAMDVKLLKAVMLDLTIGQTLKI